ncbi:MAG TPA: hypothetical protein VFP23_10450 [Solirubrobacterales bacterium]|nr:hypothetical protein [Solirubrobacterales bacterium]
MSGDGDDENAGSTTIKVGDVLMLDDRDTGASKKSVVRPCMVIAMSTAIAIVAPRTTSGSGEVSTPIGAAKGLNREGRFGSWRCRVPRAIAEAAQNNGQLGEPYRSEVLALQGLRGSGR